MFSWVSFISYTAIMSYTPGPINIISMNNAKNIGLRSSLLFNLGNYTGHFLVMLACMTFSTVLFTMIPQIQTPMKILGAAYLTYLIVRTLIPPKDDKTNGHNGDNVGNKSFVLGVLLQLINIKVILFGLTAMSSYILPYYSNIPVLILFAFLMSSIQFTGNICWTLFGSLINKLFKEHRTKINIAMAIMLLYCIIKLFT
jgi:threonine/homoserine/homoserine lactone efflux protein